MPRKPRDLPDGGTFHVFNRGVRRHDVFVTDDDRRFFLTALERVISLNNWRLLAYVLMPNHYHLVVETPDDNLVAGMHMLTTRYTMRFKRVHGIGGHMFERRFQSRPVQDQAYLEHLLGYVALNPVKDGFCADPEDWPWSSFPLVTAGRRSIIDTDRLLERLSVGTQGPLARYRACLESVRHGEETDANPRPPSEKGLTPLGGCGAVRPG